jgi:3',5'-cyclic-AMP phosphodiesterase
MPKRNLFDPNPSGFIEHDHNNDGINRRGFLKCMAWAGTGALCVIHGGVLKSYALGSQRGPETKSYKMGELSFVQISDSHMGFNKPANPDVIATLKAAVDRINALSEQPEFILHSGDISHLSKPSEFDNVDQILKAPNKEIFFVPGERDVLNDDGAMFRERYGRNSEGQSWYSFDERGVHFIGLVNVMNLKARGLGTLGRDRLEWLEDGKDHETQHSHRRICAYSALDGLPAVGMGNRRQRSGSFLPEEVWFGHGFEWAYSSDHAESERQCELPTAFSTAFPQPAPGAAEGSGPMKVPADQLRSLLGISDVNYVERRHALALVDSSLA